MKLSWGGDKGSSRMWVVYGPDLARYPVESMFADSSRVHRSDLEPHDVCRWLWCRGHASCPKFL
eukprot:9333180-Pyramimonas_sp.AAC.1